MSSQLSKGISTRIDFVGAGFAKCGTTWVSKQLSAHPHIGFSSVKETNYFASQALIDRFPEDFKTMRQVKRRDDFHALFSDDQDVAASGEFSVYYAYDRETLQNIKTYNSDIKIILCLRDPADAAVSNHSYVKNSLRASDFDDDILREVSEGSYLHTKYCYSAPLALVYSIFDAANIHIVFFNDVEERSAKALHGLYSFLGVDASFEAFDSDQKVYATAQLGPTKLTKIAKPFVSTLRRVGAHSLVDSMHNTLIRRLPAAKNQRTYDEKTRTKLRRLYAEDTARTAALLSKQSLQLPWA